MNLKQAACRLAGICPRNREVFLYALFATLWIAGSDWLLALVVDDRAALVELGAWKGFLFVAVTSWLLYRTHGTLQEEVATRRRVEDTLQKCIADLEAFSYSVSHDLRAPLAAVNSFAQAVLESEASALSEQGRHRMGRVVAGARRMDQMICDILACSRAERADMRRQQVDLAAMADEVVAEARQGWPSTHVTVGPLPTVCADPVMLRQVLCNLVGNALKFSGKRPGAQVEIAACQARGVAEITVRDNGAGFDMAYSGKLFSLFQRLHSEAEFPGTGVGLAIVKRLVSRHGGTVRAESVPGGWTSFTFTLDVAQARMPAAPVFTPQPRSVQVH